MVSQVGSEVDRLEGKIRAAVPGSKAHSRRQWICFQGVLHVDLEVDRGLNEKEKAFSEDAKFPDNLQYTHRIRRSSERKSSENGSNLEDVRD